MANLVMDGVTLASKSGSTVTVQGTNVNVNPAMEASSAFGSWELLQSTTWDGTNTNYVDFDVIDITKYYNYKVMYYISMGASGAGTTNDSSHWYHTSLRFKTGSTVIQTGSYFCNTGWRNASSYSYNDSSYSGGNVNKIWMTGNGSRYDAQGDFILSVNPFPNSRVNARGTTMLIPRFSSTTEYYVEEFSGTLQYTTADGTTNTVTGFRIFGAGGTYNSTSSTTYVYPSGYGSIQCFGLRK